MVLIVKPGPKLTNDGTFSRVQFPSGSELYSRDDNGNSFWDSVGPIRLAASGQAIYTGDNDRFEARGGLLVGDAPSDEYIMPAGRPTGTNQVLTAVGPTVNTVTWADPTGIPEAPQDGNFYARKDGAWVVIDDPAEVALFGKGA